MRLIFYIFINSFIYIHVLNFYFVITCGEELPAAERNQTENSNPHLLKEETTEIEEQNGDKQSEDFKYASLVKNLTVGVKVFNLTSKKKILQLEISWSKPTEGRLPDSYNIHVIPINTSIYDHCGEDVYYGFIREPDTTSWLVPEDKTLGMPGLHDGLTILPECTYSIILESNPHNGKLAKNISYSVSNCVEDICSCREAKYLAVPKVNAEPISMQTVNVSWTIPYNNYIDSNYSFVIRTGEKVASSKNFKGIYNMAWVKQIHVIPGQLNYYTIIIIPEKTRRNFITAVHLLDPKRCIGPPGNVTFLVDFFKNENSISFTRTEIIWVIIIPSTTCVAVLIIIICYGWRKSMNTKKRRRLYGNQRIHHVSKFRRSYKSVSLDRMSTARMIFPPLQERNLLYVEKEIEDAQTRGEADNFEISSNRITLGKEIGKGMFGRVFLAEAEAIGGVPGFTTVAVKKLKSKATSDQLEDFLAEISMMKKVGRNPNVVSMIGCCSISQPYLIIMEYIPCGDLLQYLRELRSQVRQPLLPSESTKNTNSSVSRSSESTSYVEPETIVMGTASLFSTSSRQSNLSEPPQKLEYILDPRELQSFAQQIAKGMSHLEQKHITHRDLAARNILIDQNKTLKISDFGLSRTGIYVNTKNKKVPLRWLSIEAIKDSLYSSKSDVWAFGIVLWEIGTLEHTNVLEPILSFYSTFSVEFTGGYPYANVIDLNLLNYLLEGNRLDKPANCSDELYKMMRLCWSHCADSRPTFQQLVSYLDTSAASRRVYVNFENTKNDLILPPTEQIPTQKNSSQSENK